MKSQHINIGLLITNLAILFFIITGQKKTDNTVRKDSYGEGVQPIVKANIIELVDKKGQVRTQLKVEDDGSVVFRMKDAQGNIRVKLGADIEGSGLVLLDNKTEPAIHALASSKGSFLTVQNQNGKKQIIQP